MFKKVLIANRGEIAVRVIRACRDLGVSPVAIYSEPDRDSLVVKLADQAYCVGPAAASESYLNIEKIIEVARRSGAEAVHPGYGFLAENDEFVEACDSAGIVFIGPSAESMRAMGDKLESRRTVRAAGVPVIPGGDDPVPTAEEAGRLAREIGFPVMIKASAGGGGKGLRRVSSADEVRGAFEAARGEALASFGDPTVFVERCLDRPRHIEFQVLGDRHGNLIHLGERECSIQRRHQKVVEECPSPLMTESLRRKMGEAAVAAARSVGYYNAGTVEFLVDTSRGGEPEFFFLEMNTRLQVEHPVTEAVTGLDLVREQFRVASGEALGYGQEAIRWSGAAVECRIYAEDPERGFAPCPGRLTSLFEPSGPGVRNDSGVYTGATVSIFYDPMISKLVTHGSDRNEALARMRRALREYKVGGVRTTIPFFERLISHPEFVAGRLHTHFIEEHGLAGAVKDLDDRARVALIAAVISYLKERKSGEETVDEPAMSPWKASGRFKRRYP